MLTGTELGAAIEAARGKKGVTKKALAAHFGVTSPAVQDWVRRGTIGKEKLEQLWAYFADVVGPEHWGLKAFPASQNSAAPALPSPFQEWAATASPRSMTTIKRLAEAAQRNELRDEDWQLIETLYERFRKR